jgi:hypothetical protein
MTYRSLAAIRSNVKASWERTPKFPQSLDRCLPATIPANLEFPGAGYPYLDLVAFLQLQGLDHSGRQPDSKTVSPL